MKSGFPHALQRLDDFEGSTRDEDTEFIDFPLDAIWENSRPGNPRTIFVGERG